MDGIDKAEIQRKIIEISKGSSYYENEVEKSRKLQKQVRTVEGKNIEC